MKNLSSLLARLTAIGLWCFCSAPILTAAEFSPALDAQLQSAQSSDLISAIVILPGTIDIRSLDLKLHEESADLARRHAEIIAALQYNAATTQPPFRAELDAAMDAGAVTGYTAYWIENLLVVQATNEFLESLRTRGDIAFVMENYRADPIESLPANEHGAPHSLDNLTINNGVLACGAYRVNTELGVTGEGTIVGNLDTGVNGNHPALTNRWRGNFAPWQECWRDAIGGTSFPSDGMNHGTPTMGAITGREFDGVDTIWTGCAPNARWIADNAINQSLGGEFNNDIIDAFQWFADPDGDPGTLGDVPDVIANSWGVSIYFGYPQCYDAWNTVIQNCEAAGPVVTWSAGAEGPAGVMRSPAIFSLNAEQIFTVGSVDATGYPNMPYPLTSWSTRGPTPCVPAIPDNIKPEIVSPAINIYTCSGSGYTYYSGVVCGGACRRCRRLDARSVPRLRLYHDQGGATEYGH